MHQVLIIVPVVDRGRNVSQNGRRRPTTYSMVTLTTFKPPPPAISRYAVHFPVIQKQPSHLPIFRLAISHQRGFGVLGLTSQPRKKWHKDAGSVLVCSKERAEVSCIQIFTDFEDDFFRKTLVGGHGDRLFGGPFGRWLGLGCWESKDEYITLTKRDVVNRIGRIPGPAFLGFSIRLKLDFPYLDSQRKHILGTDHFTSYLQPASQIAPASSLYSLANKIYSVNISGESSRKGWFPLNDTRLQPAPSLILCSPPSRRNFLHPEPPTSPWQ